MRFFTDLYLCRAPVAGFLQVALVWGAFGGLVPQIKAQIEAEDGVFGLALLLGTLGAISAMWFAPLLDEKLKRYAMMFAGLGLALAMMLPGHAVTWGLFVVTMCGLSAGSGALDVLGNAEIARIEEREGRPLMALNHGMYSLAYAGAAFGTGALREHGWSVGQIYGLFALISLLLVPLMRGLESSDSMQAKGGVAGSKGTPKMLVLVGGAILLVAFVTEQSIEGWSALHLERGMGASAAQGAAGPALMGLTMGIGRLVTQWLSRHFDSFSLIRVGALAAIAGVMLTVVATSLPLAYVGFAVLGLGVSVIAPMCLVLVSRAVAARQRTRLIARVSLIGYAGFFFGPPMMGFLSQFFGLRTSFSAVAVMLLVVVVVLLPMLQRASASTTASAPRTPAE